MVVPQGAPGHSFEPLRSALAAGGPPMLTAAWKRWVVERHARRRVNAPAAALAARMGEPVRVADRLIDAWSYEAERAAFAEPAGLYARFLAAVHDLTQDWLRERGITSAWLWRGETAPGPERRCRLAVTLQERTLATTILAYAAHMVRWRQEQAEDGVGGRLLLLEVPATRIVGCSATGLGIPDASEVSLAGGAYAAWCWPLDARAIARSAEPGAEAALLAALVDEADLADGPDDPCIARWIHALHGAGPGGASSPRS